MFTGSSELPGVGKMNGEGIRFAGPGSGAKGQGEVESGKEERPAGLTGIQTFGSTNVFKVFIISPYQERHF